MAIGTKRQQSILTLAKYSMTLVGFWQYPSQKYPLKLLYSIYSAFFVIYFMTYTCSVCIKFAITLTTASTFDSEIIKQLAFTLSILMTMYVVMVCHSSGFNKILSYIVNEERSILQTEDFDILKSHLQQIRNCNNLNAIYAVFTFGTGFAMALENYLQSIEVARYNSDRNTTLERPQLVGLYYFGINPYKHADLLLVISEICILFNVLIMLSSKLGVFTCVIFGISLLKKLQISFRKMGVDRENALAVLNRLVDDHQRVIAFADKLNASIKYLILVEYILNSLNVAAVSVQFITYDKKMLLLPFFYLFFLLIQVFIMGIGANEISVESVNLSNALYFSPWYEQSEAAKKVILIIIARTQKPINLTIGQFRPMVIDSALAICKASYSYVTLMMHNVQ
ncbi:uncharacterized protein LOC132706620 isoform X2 [Cylas formicarius]|nr:uncharacterized protein LOC132706620 isoform X2 [Cylas formicarius]